jgi:hypothetical protein
MVLGGALVCSGLAAVPMARAGNAVGDIQVVYNAPSTFDFNGSFNGSFNGAPIGILDGPVFIIQNTSGTAITNGVLSIGVGGDNATADSFSLGTIPAESYVAVGPGLSNDGASGHTFFTYTGSLLDTSDVGPTSNSVPFSFTGLEGGNTVLTGTFTPGATAGPSNDGTVTNPPLNFLGGPGNNDGPCNNCFGPKIVADISFASVPEPASWLLLGTSMTVLMVLGRLGARRPVRGSANRHSLACPGLTGRQ